MNKFLADAIGTLNGVMAGVIMVLGIWVGVNYFDSYPVLIIIAPVLGLLSAIMLCGLLAIFVEIRNILQETLELNYAVTKSRLKSEPTVTRVEPKVAALRFKH